MQIKKFPNDFEKRAQIWFGKFFFLLKLTLKKKKKETKPRKLWIFWVAKPRFMELKMLFLSLWSLDNFFFVPSSLCRFFFNCRTKTIAHTYTGCCCCYCCCEEYVQVSNAQQMIFNLPFFSVRSFVRLSSVSVGCFRVLLIMIFVYCQLIFMLFHWHHRARTTQMIPFEQVSVLSQMSKHKNDQNKWIFSRRILTNETTHTTRYIDEII